MHHALRARFCIERGRYWQAEYWISGARDYALSLACLKSGLSTSHGRGFDELPPEVRDKFTPSLVASIDRDELLHALTQVIHALLDGANQVEELAIQVEPQLRELTYAGDS